MSQYRTGLLLGGPSAPQGHLVSLVDTIESIVLVWRCNIDDHAGNHMGNILQLKQVKPSMIRSALRRLLVHVQQICQAAR